MGSAARARGGGGGELGGQGADGAVAAGGDTGDDWELVTAGWCGDGAAGGLVRVLCVWGGGGGCVENGEFLWH